MSECLSDRSDALPWRTRVAPGVEAWYSTDSREVAAHWIASGLEVEECDLAGPDPAVRGMLLMNVQVR